VLLHTNEAVAELTPAPSAKAESDRISGATVHAKGKRPDPPHAKPAYTIVVRNWKRMRLTAPRDNRRGDNRTQ